MKWVSNFGQEFKTFAVKGSAIDLAVGLIIGTSFTGVVNSLVKDVLMPPIGLLFSSVDFSELYIDLSGKGYRSLAYAQQVGAPTINYGIFLNAVIVFVITAFVLFLVVRGINRMRGDSIKPKATKK